MISNYHNKNNFEQIKSKTSNNIKVKLEEKTSQPLELILLNDCTKLLAQGPYPCLKFKSSTAGLL